MPDIFSRWFLTDAIPIELCITYRHEAWLVALSYIAAAFASYTAFHVVERVRSAADETARRIWLAIAGVAMGCGIFSMHFIAVLAIRSPIALAFDVSATLLSAAFAMAASAIAFHFVDGGDRNPTRLCIGAVILGAGIGLMHYAGMAALRMPARLYYDPALFALSVVVAVILSAGALYVLRASAGWHGRSRLRHVGSRLGGALLMGLAISLMHYTGMLATNFYPDPGAGTGGVTLDTTLMSIAVGALTFLIGGFSIIATLLDHRAAAAEAIRAQTAGFLQTVIDNSGDGILTLDSANVIRTCNPAAGRIFGRAVADIIDRPFGGLICDDPCARIGCAECLSCRQAEIVRGDGDHLVIEYTVNRMQFGGADHYVVVVRDISQQHKTQQLLEEARRAAEDASHAKSDFLATMSHEIRTPLNGVLGMANLLLETGLDEDQRRQAETIRTSGTALLTILNDILDYSKLEVGRLELEEAAFDLGDVVASVIDLLWPQASGKGIQLVGCLAPATARPLVGDAGRLRQVLLNLVSNAIKFTSGGGVTLRVLGDASTDCSVALTIEVVDTGIGMTKEAQRRLFQRFVQADTSTTRKYGGSGLGLAISRQLVELMGGMIDMKSVAGEGSSFRICLTLPHAETDEGGPDVMPGFTGIDLRPLVATGNRTLREALVEQFALWGVISDAAEDIDGARAALQSGRYNLVLADQPLISADGGNLYADITRNPHLAGCRRVLLADGYAPDNGRSPPGPETDGVLHMPVHAPTLHDAIAELVPCDRRYARSTENHNPGDRPVAMRPLRLLVVDDNHVNQLVAKAMLIAGGHTIDVAGNGIEALMMVGRTRYDAILMDIQMPEMDGVEATQRIRTLPGPVARTPIIAMTANAMKGDRERYLGAGMDDYVSKPIHSKQLALALGRATGAAITVQGIALPEGDGAAPGKLVAEDILPVLAELDIALDELGGG